MNVVLQDEPVSAGAVDSLVLQPHSVVFLELSGTTITSLGNEPGAPGTFALYPNYPNPFTPLDSHGGERGSRSAILSNGVNPATTIRYQLSVASQVEMAIYDLRGRRVRTLVRGRQSAGEHTVTWDGKDDRGQIVSSGVYLYRLVAGEQVQVRRMLILR
ncbi:MAG: FlgD immunoglobulin-like domain containing protein [candidate division KSB1 bacterium]|nr:FlgD immunoglobulin-like domain containing protein [candidate division KSB1 bacterium]